MAEQFLDGAEHEGDWSSKFVTDVAEEDGLGAIEFGESVGAAFFIFGGASVVDGADELIDDEREKGEVFGVKIAGGVDATNQEAEWNGLSRRCDGKNDGFRNGLVGGTDRKCSVRWELDDLSFGEGDDFVERPKRARSLVIKRHLARTDASDVFGDVNRAFEDGGGRCGAGFHQVEERERNIVGIVGESGEKAGAGGAGGFFEKRVRGELGECAEAAGVESVGGALRTGTKEAGDFAGFVEDGAVGERIVGFFEAIAAAHEQSTIVNIGGFTYGVHLFDERADVTPDLGPDRPHGAPKSPRVLRKAEDGDVRVVVKESHLRSPADPHGVLRIEHEIDGALQTGGPGVNGAKRSNRPIVLRDQATHYAVAEDGFWSEWNWFMPAILRDAIDCGDEVVGDIGFGDESARVNFYGLTLHDARFVLADENHFGVGKRGANEASGVEAAPVGHRDVHQHDVGEEFLGFIHALNAVGGFAADFEIGTAGEQGSNAAAHEFVIVND